MFRKNRQGISKIVTHSKEIVAYLQLLSSRDHSINARLRRPEVSQTVDRIINVLELVGELYKEEKRLYHNQRAALKVGHLTEDLLNPRDLEEILQKAVAQRYQVITQLEWYYQSLIVEPMLSEKDNLLYRVVIPLIHDDQYLQYSIQIFPLPYPNSNTITQLELHTNYGFNTETGELFEPHACQGKRPAVSLWTTLWAQNPSNAHFCYKYQSWHIDTY